MRPVMSDVRVRQINEATAAAAPRAIAAILTAVEAAPDTRRRSEASRRTRSSSDSAGTLPNLGRQDVASLERVLVPLMDPMIALGEVQARVRNLRAEASETEAADSADRAEIAEAERQRQLEKARKALAKKMRGLPRWLKGIVAAVVAAIGAVASVVTGGASAVLAGVALAFMLAGDALNALVNHGILPAKPTSYIAVGLKVVGAVLAMVASFGASSADAAATIGSVTAQIVQTANQVATTVKTVVEVYDGTVSVNNAVRRFRADMAQALAEFQAGLRDDANEELEDAIGEMRGLHQSFTRVMQRLRLAVDAAGESGMTAASA